MQAVRIHPSSSSTPFSPINPAPTSALHVDKISDVPHASNAGEILVRVKASTVVRDMLTWPEMLKHEFFIPGADFSGIVQDPGTTNFRIGDEVFGMVNFDPPRGGTWAEYAIVKQGEVGHKPKTLSWEEAASVPLSALTAHQALFRHAGLSPPNIGPSNEKKVLITGAAGAVGVFLVQLAKLTGCHIVAATSSNARNSELLKELGASEAVQYTELQNRSRTFDAIIDCVGGDVLKQCWDLAAPGGTLVSIDSPSWNFVQEHQDGDSQRKDVKGIWFIVESCSSGLEQVSELLESGSLKTFVATSFPLEQVRDAYDAGNGRRAGRGKVVITM